MWFKSQVLRKTKKTASKMLSSCLKFTLLPSLKLLNKSIATIRLLCSHSCSQFWKQIYCTLTSSAATIYVRSCKSDLKRGLRLSMKRSTTVRHRREKSIFWVAFWAFIFWERPCGLRFAQFNSCVCRLMTIVRKWFHQSSHWSDWRQQWL